MKNIVKLLFLNLLFYLPANLSAQELKDSLAYEYNVALYDVGDLRTGNFIGQIGDYYYVYTSKDSYHNQQMRLEKYNIKGGIERSVYIQLEVENCYKRLEYQGYRKFKEPLRDQYKIINNELYHFIPDEDIQTHTRRVWVEKIDLETLESFEPQLLFEHTVAEDEFMKYRKSPFSLAVIQRKELNFLYIKSQYSNEKIDLIKVEDGIFEALNLNIESKENFLMQLDPNNIAITSNKLRVPIFYLHRQNDISHVELHTTDLNSKIGSKQITFNSLNFAPIHHFDYRVIFEGNLMKFIFFYRPTNDLTRNLYSIYAYDLTTQDIFHHQGQIPGLNKKTFMHEYDRDVMSKKWTYFTENMDTSFFDLHFREIFQSSEGKTYIVASYQINKRLGTINGPNAYFNDYRFSKDLPGDLFVFELNTDLSISYLNTIDIYNYPNPDNYDYYVTHGGNYPKLDYPLLTFKNNKIYFVHSNYEDPNHRDMGPRHIEITALDLVNNKISNLGKIRGHEFLTQSIYARIPFDKAHNTGYRSKNGDRYILQLNLKIK
ncbi:hypothetical protein SAMN05216474_0945 [Lishizhenia tianjinensis]|uniref:DKNYY family protein n=1 Tax=Lishizhenia tianjinensis TaxID=477690 RepID=A0A1I6YJC9_9FLAO|nr:hypothetical protein [Lishizhenia tianjinensis]SFT50585.1 hypothetical protein SAMN05216474_0945 [Lishizhenia tianjinensis]